MKQVFWTIGILTTQILILNHIQIYGFGTPLACVLPILLFPLDSPRWQILLSGFVIGLIEDIFINTPGVTAATFTLIAMIQPHLLKAVSSRDNEDKTTIPSAQNLGWASYVKYILSDRRGKKFPPSVIVENAFGVFGLLLFTVMFFTGFEPMFKTFFIWEVTFIMLLLVILNSERIF
jgi:rod shape-determining protein MreD